MTPQRNIEDILRLATRLGRRPPYRIDLERLVWDDAYRSDVRQAARAVGL